MKNKEHFCYKLYIIFYDIKHYKSLNVSIKTIFQVKNCCKNNSCVLGVTRGFIE